MIRPWSCHCQFLFHDNFGNVHHQEFIFFLVAKPSNASWCCFTLWPEKIMSLTFFSAMHDSTSIMIIHKLILNQKNRNANVKYKSTIATRPCTYRYRYTLVCSGTESQCPGRTLSLDPPSVLSPLSSSLLLLHRILPGRTRSFLGVRCQEVDWSRTLGI